MLPRISAAIVATLFAVLLWAPTSSYAAKPQRIVSLNLCTDQLLMMLVPRDRIVAVSYLARDPTTSVMHREARSIPVTHAKAEEVFVLQPDLILAGTFTSRATVNILKRVGRTVEEFPPAYSFADIRKNLRRLADLVGEQARAEDLLAQFDADLRRYLDDQPADRPLAAFYYSNSYTSGDSTLANEVLQAAGMRNLGREIGLKQTKTLPLEVLVTASPDLIVKGRTYENPALAQEVFQHPAMTYLSARSDEALIADKYTICGTPFTYRAVARLAEARRNLEKPETSSRQSAHDADTAK